MAKSRFLSSDVSIFLRDFPGVSHYHLLEVVGIDFSVNPDYAFVAMRAPLSSLTFDYIDKIVPGREIRLVCCEDWARTEYEPSRVIFTIKPCFPINVTISAMSVNRPEDNEDVEINWDFAARVEHGPYLKRYDG